MKPEFPTVKIETLSLVNVGPYFGSQVFELNTEQDRPLVLIGGQNGGGKTTFLDSIQLCLYGNRANCAGREGMPYDDYLKSLITHGTAMGEYSRIEIEFETAIGGVRKVHHVSRIWRHDKKSGVKEKLEVSINGVADKAVTDSWRDYIEDVLPLELMDLFLFDGEKIKELASVETSAAIVRSAISTLLGASSFERIRNDLKVIQRRQFRELSNTKDDRAEFDVAESELENALATRSNVELELKEGQAQLGTLQSELAVETAKFKNDGGELFLQREDLQSSLTGLIVEREDVVGELRNLLATEAPFLFVFELIPMYIKSIEKSQTTSRLRTFLDQLPAYNDFIFSLFGPNVPDAFKTKVEAEVARIAAQTKDGSFDDSLRPDAALALGFLYTHLPNVKASLDKYHSKLAGVLEDIDAYESKLSMVPSESRVASSISAMNLIGSKIKELEIHLANLSDRLHASKLEVEKAEVKLAEIEASRLELLALNDRNERVLNSIRMADAVLEELERTQIEKHLARIEAATLESFNDLIRKDNLIDKITINRDSFKILLTDSNDVSIPFPSISSGERQILATALLWGLSKVSGKSVPTIIDTPMGRLDSVNRKLIASRYLPFAANQVILLSTDEEIDREIYPILEPYVSREYSLDFNSEVNQTSVSRGYPWK
jgi:DNA sulfur modification protein DndD